MSVALKIVDQVPGSRPMKARELRLVSERMTMRELIKRRIETEVAEINSGNSEIAPLVRPSAQEEKLNGKPARKKIDAERQLAAAIEGFSKSRILVIVGDRQIQELDEPITFEPDTEVVFLKLVPLVGG